MKSGQPALQLAVRGPSGNEKRTAAQERVEETGEQEDRGRRRRRNQEAFIEDMREKKRAVYHMWGE